LGLGREAVHCGSFDLAADPVERGAGPRRARPQARPRPDYTVFDHDHDLDADLTA